MTQTTARGSASSFLLVEVLGLITTPFSMSSQLLLGLFNQGLPIALGWWGAGPENPEARDAMVETGASRSQ